MSYQEIKSEQLFDTPAPMSQATLARGTSVLNISGQTAQNATGDTVALGDIEGQTEQALANIKALIEEAGGNLSDISRLVIFLTDRSQFPKVMGVRRRVFAAPYPATTAVVVAGLAKEEWLIEIEATAFLESSAT